VSLLGREGSKARLQQLVEKMRAALEPLDARADALRRLAEFAVARDH
jgi:farnesyl diphosphate synthase